MALSSAASTLPGYRELQEWSASDLPGFWSAIWDYFQVDASSTADIDPRVRTHA